MQVVVFDGDGSVLMNLGGLSTLARYRPANLVHVVFDNESLLSVGGFPTATGTCTRLAEVAAAAGVPRTRVRDDDRRVREGIRRGAAGARADDAGREGRGDRARRRSSPNSALLENRFQFQRYLQEHASRLMSSLAALVADLAAGRVAVVDLTQPLGPETPVIGLPPMFAASPA